MQSLTLSPQHCSLHGLTLHERIDVNALHKLINSCLLKENISKWKRHSYTSEKQQLEKYATLIKNGVASVQYFKSKVKVNDVEQSWGRCNPANMVSLFTLRKEIRHTISAHYYTDIDIANCQPAILYHICKQFGIKCVKLEDYVLNRKKYIDSVESYYKVDYDNAKKLFIIILYGGGFKKWAEERKITLGPLDFIEDFILEFQEIAKRITAANPLIRDYVIARKEQKGTKSYNLNGATIALYLQEMEVRILEHIYKYLVENKLVENKSLVLCADGVMIETAKYTVDLLQKLTDYIFNVFGFQLVFTTKPMDKIFKKIDINESLIFNLHRPEFTTGLLGEYFKILYDDFIYSNSKVYFFNGVHWQEDTGFIKLINQVDTKFFHDLLHYYCKRREVLVKSEVVSLTETQREENKKELALLEKFHKNISLLRQIKFKKNLREDICNKIFEAEVNFDNKPHIFAFKNKIFNLALGKSVQPDKYDYIHETCGYDYDEYFNQAKVEEYNRLIDTIFPNKEVRSYYLACLSTGLTGYHVENLFIATGKGGNGKGVINSQMLKTCGNYGYKLSSSVLLSEIKEGANPQIALLQKIRFALTTEPSGKKRIICSTAKELTGDSTINARMAYSNACKIILMLTLFMECNELPKLDEVNEAMERRIRAIPFVSSFKSQEDYDRCIDKTNVYLGNPKYKTDAFAEENKQTLFEILLPFCKEFINSGLLLPKSPAPCKALTIDYLAMSDNIYEWVLAKYSPGTDADILYISDIFDLFKSSDYFENLTKQEKRNITLKTFTEKIQNNLFLKDKFKSRDEYIGSLQIRQAAIVGFKL